MRASSVVNCQSALLCLRFRSACQATISLIGGQAKRPDTERFSVTVMNDVGESRAEGTEGRCQSKLA